MFLLTKVKTALFQPDKFFEGIKQETSIKPAFAYYAILYAFSMLLAMLTVSPLLFVLTSMFPAGYVIVFVIALYVIGLLSSFFVAGVIHLCIRLLGGKGTYTQTYQVYAYSMTPLFVFSVIYSLSTFVSGIGSGLAVIFLLMILMMFLSIVSLGYTLISLVKGTKILHGIETLKAIIAYVVAAVLFIIIYVLITSLLVALSYMWLQGTMMEATKNTDDAINQATMMRQGIDITTAYQCGSDICFEIKAASTNTLPIDPSGAQYWVHDTLEEISLWDGGISGGSCTAIIGLVPGQRCYGKILNLECIKDSELKVSLASGYESSKVITGCNSTDIF